MNIVTFNYIEACLWFTITVVLLVAVLTNAKVAPYKIITYYAAACFFMFGVSDLIEVQTGAWWKPVSLLLLNSACIIGFCYLFYRYIKIKNGN